MTSIPVFSQELIDKIVDAAAQEPKPAPTLKALSLASKSRFLKRSRLHLFSHITLDNLTISEASPAVKILKQAPHLFKLVRAVTALFLYASQGWRSRSTELLQQIVSRLEGLDTLNVRSPPGSRPWKDPHSADRALISQLLNHPLRTLVIFNHFPGLPFELLQGQCNLQALSVYNTKISEARGQDLTSLFARLKELHLRNDGLTEVVTALFPSWRAPSIPMSLVRLVLCPDKLELYDSTWNAIGALAGCTTLQDVHLEFSAVVQGVWGTDLAALVHYYENPTHSLPTFPSLLSLQVDIPLVCMRNISRNELGQIRHEVIPQYLVHVLGKAAQPSLQLYGSAFVVDVPREPLELGFDGYDGWRELDDVLSNQELYPSLKAVSQTLGSTNTRDVHDPRRALPKTARKCLMDSSSKGEKYRNVRKLVEEKMTFGPVWSGPSSILLSS